MWRYLIFSLTIPSVLTIEKYKVCVVDGKGLFKKASKYCPELDANPDSKVECVIGLDRSDCLRKISKGSADWSVFTSEDLITAQNSRVEMLITNEMKFTKDKYEYEVVAVVNKKSGINDKHDLRGKALCHPGYGYETDWTTILSNYFENNVVPHKCLPTLTLIENRIKASSDYFSSACKAGSWVIDPEIDRNLKLKYKNLCELCSDRGSCSSSDEYWGRSGSLNCLTDGAGDVSWSRLDDVRAHFSSRLSSPGDWDNFGFLCPEGGVVSLNSSAPCVWVVKPWPIVATRRKTAQQIQDLLQSLSHNDVATTTTTSWQSQTLSLIQNYNVEIRRVGVGFPEAVESYLDRAPGYLSANSFAGCDPPRSIRLCTVSNLENAKCDWLQQAAAVYGVEPAIECLKADNKTHCMSAIKDGIVDLVLIRPEQITVANKLYNLKPLFYETVSDSNKYLTIAFFDKKKMSGKSIKRMEDLKGTKSCFPSYEGIAYQTVLATLRNLSNDYRRNDFELLSDFFEDSCVPGLKTTSANDGSKLKKLCERHFERDEDFGALRCLVSGKADVAFVSQNSVERFFHDLREKKNIKVPKSDLEIMCDSEKEGEKSSGIFDVNKRWCHLSWAPVGVAMVRQNVTEIWSKDALDAFTQIDQLFGKNHRSVINTITMFGQFDGRVDVLFRDVTEALRASPCVKNTDDMPRLFFELINRTLHPDDNNFKSSSSSPAAIYKTNFVFIYNLIISIIINYTLYSMYI